MSLEEYFLVPEMIRRDFVKNEILRFIPQGSRGPISTSIHELLDLFAGADLDPLLILSYAVEQGKFGKYFEILSGLHSRFVSKVPYEDRSVNDQPSNVQTKPINPNMRETKRVFDFLYEQLGVKYNSVRI